MTTLTSLVVTGGSLAAAGGLAWLRHLGSGPRPLTVADIVADAPPELRTAVSILAEPSQTNLMLAALGLGSIDGGFPYVERYDYTDHGLDVEILMLGGQSLADWSNDETLAQFATYLGVPKVTASSPAPSWVRLQVRAWDTLAAPSVLPGAVHSVVDLEAVPVGVTEDYETWRLRVLYGHILLAGATGSGKGSVLWSILAALGMAILTGLVDVWLADPKGGAEFGRGENKLFVRFSTDTATILAMLTEAVEEMRERLARMRAQGIRKIVPSTDEPLILIIIDEAASLSSYATRDEQQEFRRLTGLLLSQGRAAAVSVIAALQDPSKETMPNRQLFPIRIGLRLDEPTQTTMVHGQGARDRGARCDEISEHTPGVGYVGEDGSTGFVRVRAYWVDDAAADAIVATYSPAPEITGPAEDYSDFNPDDLGDGTTDGDGLVAA
ncbi:FtsK/SpoIIIE domain-containing protein [Nocardia lijiangensis]|uniref:FtsK/SpoIIIE domain-containing protein n=1 Tax=Nocardia lijiangensis TaxID=299618 RepID=UPI0008363095|nr:FtsK/SpoIIIE domain-containing protein [Nocardia lijiangensis]